MRARVISSTLNLRSAAQIADNVVRVLPHGRIVETLAGAPSARRWAHVQAGADAGYVARRLVAQSPDRPLASVPADALSLLDATLWNATATYDAITYRLGCKARRNGDQLVFSGSDVDGAPCSGHTVDCSGWVDGLFRLAAAAVNAQQGRTVIANAVLNRLATHSDGQISNIGEAVGQVYSGLDIDQLPLRSGLLFGLNAGDYDWEGQDRAFEIDHIVMGMRGPDGFYISQSSSSGGGVNRQTWTTWRQGFSSLFSSYRVHCVDLLALGQWTPPPAPAPADADELLNPLEAPPG